MSQSFHTVVFVCEQNVYRSIAAEAVFKYLCAATQLPLRVTSAGVYAGDGESPDDNIVQVANQRGYDIDGLRSRRLREDDLRAGTLLVASDLHVATTLRNLVTKMAGADAKANSTESTDAAEDAPSSDGADAPSFAPPQVELLTQFAQTFASEFKDNKNLVVGESPRAARDLLDRVEDSCLGLLNTLKPQ